MKKHTLTAKSLGLAAGTKLSTSYANTRANFKVVEDYVIGYAVMGGHRNAVRIAPIYRAMIFCAGKPQRMVNSYEIGPHFNPPRNADAEPDTDGDALAGLAATALVALEHHAAREAIQLPVTKPARKRRGT